MNILSQIMMFDSSRYSTQQLRIASQQMRMRSSRGTEDAKTSKYFSHQRLAIQVEQNQESSSVTLPTDRREREDKREQESYLSVPRYNEKMQRSLNNPLLNLKINASRQQMQALGQDLKIQIQPKSATNASRQSRQQLASSNRQTCENFYRDSRPNKLAYNFLTGSKQGQVNNMLNSQQDDLFLKQLRLDQICIKNPEPKRELRNSRNLKQNHISELPRRMQLGTANNKNAYITNALSDATVLAQDVQRIHLEPSKKQLTGKTNTGQVSLISHQYNLKQNQDELKISERGSETQISQFKRTTGVINRDIANMPRDKFYIQGDNESHTHNQSNPMMNQTIQKQTTFQVTPQATMSDLELNKDLMPFEQNDLAKVMSQRNLGKEKDSRKSPTQVKGKLKQKPKAAGYVGVSKESGLSQTIMVSITGSEKGGARVSVLRKEVDKDGKLINPSATQTNMPKQDSIKLQSESSEDTASMDEHLQKVRNIEQSQQTSESVSIDDSENDNKQDLVTYSSDEEVAHHTLKVATYYNKTIEPKQHRCEKLYRPRTAAPVGPYLRKGTGILASTVRRNEKYRQSQDQQTSPERWVFDKESMIF